jgi:hypothetical protein
LGRYFHRRFSAESHLREERQVLGTMLGQVLREPALVNLEVQMQKLRKATALRFFAMGFLATSASIFCVCLRFFPFSFNFFGSVLVPFSKATMEAVP